MLSFEKIWDSVFGVLQRDIPITSIDLFIKEILPESFDGVTATLVLPSDFQLGIVETRYKDTIEKAFLEVLGFEVKTNFILKDDINIELNSDGSAGVVPSGGYDFSFDTFITGESNRFAHAAALAVSKNPSATYNPLFIHGGSGLGKTHLLSAISNEIKKNYPNFVILYVKSEDFMNDLIHAIQNNTTADFRDKYRSVDVLLMDDIQFVSGKESMQEELFHTFNTLYQSEKQIVITSDRPPKEIKSLEERLRTRFEWGLLADIAPPDFETRVAIIKRKSELLSLAITDEIASFIATKLKSNIRQLEGVVKKIKAYNELSGLIPTVALAQMAVHDTISEDFPATVTIDKIISEVARTFATSPDSILSKNQSAAVSNARQVTAYIIREVTGMSVSDIGEELGRDHSTIVYNLQVMEKKMKKDSSLRSTVEDIIKNIKGL